MDFRYNVVADDERLRARQSRVWVACSGTADYFEKACTGLLKTESNELTLQRLRSELPRYASFVGAHFGIAPAEVAPQVLACGTGSKRG